MSKLQPCGGKSASSLREDLTKETAKKQILGASSGGEQASTSIPDTPLDDPEADADADFSSCSDSELTDDGEPTRRSKKPVVEKTNDHREAQYECYRCFQTGLSCEVVPGNEKKPCLNCEIAGKGRSSCNAEQFISIGKGPAGELRTRIRRAVWHYKHRDQKPENGKYKIWRPQPVVVDLYAAAPTWQRAAQSRCGRDPHLWSDVVAFREDRDDYGEIGRYLKKRPNGWTARLENYKAGKELSDRTSADLARLKRRLRAEKEDLIDAGKLPDLVKTNAEQTTRT